MRFLSGDEFEALIAGAELLRADGFGPKVYRAPDNRVVKLFRVKRWWTSSMFYPYSLRFVRNAHRLKRHGVPCVDVDDIFYCHAIRRHGVIYQRLEGQPLDDLLNEESEQGDRTFQDYARFMAQLHAMRIYFRSLHPGNVLQLPQDGFGLIDVGDMRFPLLPLSTERRRRNFRHLLRSIEFRDALRHHAPEQFIDAYLAAAQLSATKAQRLRGQLLADFQGALPMQS